MPTCRDVTERASDYLEGRMGRLEGWWFAIHLVICRACRRFVDQIRTTVELLGQLGPGPGPAPETREALLESFRSGSGSGPGS